MVTIQSGMLIALGFLTAMLLGLLLAPAFWSRAVRLTTKRLKESVPLTESEIEADRDRIRAEYAIKMHKLETLVEQVKLAGARQQIEINRRDARVNMLESDLERLKASYEEAQNARRVLEQTIADRLPKVESRLTEAKKVLFSRDRQIGELTTTAERHAKALADANATIARQKAEIDRLGSAPGRAREAPASGREAALKSEIEALQARIAAQDAELAALRRTGAGQTPAGAEASSGPASELASLQRQIAGLRTRNDDHVAEIARLKAALAAHESESSGGSPVRESRVALRARIQALEAQGSEQTATIARLRAELEAAGAMPERQVNEWPGEAGKDGGAASTDATAAPARAVAAGSGGRAGLAERVAAGATLGPADEAAGAAKDAVNAGRFAVVPATSAKAEAEETVRTKEPPAATTSAGPSQGDDAQVGVPAKATRPRPRLLDRIASLSRTS